MANVAGDIFVIIASPDILQLLVAFERIRFPQLGALMI